MRRSRISTSRLSCRAPGQHRLVSRLLLLLVSPRPGLASARCAELVCQGKEAQLQAGQLVEASDVAAAAHTLCNLQGSRWLQVDICGSLPEHCGLCSVARSALAAEHKAGALQALRHLHSPSQLDKALCGVTGLTYGCL